jgi:ubiquinone/menaquinone biosynthesis C-methylase UbiE
MSHESPGASVKAEPNGQLSKTSGDFSIVTELPGDRITREAMRMLQTRYALARNYCAGKDVLELACGPALGLAYLAGNAKVVGGDCNFRLLRDVLVRTGKQLPLVCMDAQRLPFREESFDVVLLFEAIYYLDDPERCLCECRRVMRRGGSLILCLANRDWPGFKTSPFSRRYFSAVELYDLLAECGFAPELYGAFPSRPATMVQHLRDRVRRLAVRMNLIPKTLRHKATLKRLFYGSLETIGTELVDPEIPVDPLFPIPRGQSQLESRILYAIGHPSISSPLAHAADLDKALEVLKRQDQKVCGQEVQLDT